MHELRFLAALAALFEAGCASKYVIHARPAEPFDAVVVPGCPSEDDGSPSRCQVGRAGQAALLWRDHWTSHFIVSGSDVHTPYVEAEALAEEMTLLGVPPDRIVLERDALHSDENVYYSLRIARERGYGRLAVVSTGPSGWLCLLMVQWGEPCSAIPLDIGALQTLLPPYEERLHALHARRSDPWETLEAREARIAKANGHGRPPSFVLYPLYWWLGRYHRPIAPAHPATTWAEWLLGTPDAGESAGGQGCRSGRAKGAEPR